MIISSVSPPVNSPVKMRKLNIALAAVLGSVLVVSAAYAVDFKTIFHGIFGGEQFGKLEVSEVAALMKNDSKNVAVFDANPSNVRESEGVVQGANLLSSS